MKYIVGFDGLRAFSIILVLLTHLGIQLHLPDSEFVNDRVWLLISGETGVQVFFALSGFLITSILIRQTGKTTRAHFRSFYARRFLRLLPPLILFYLAVGILMGLEVIQPSKAGFLYSFFYVYNFVPNEFATGEIGHTWSLAVEEQFYFTWPFVLYFFRNSKIRIILGVLALCLIGYSVLPLADFAVGFKPHRWFIPAVAPIMIGSLFALLNVQNRASWESLFLNNRTIVLIAVGLYAFPLYVPNQMLPIAPMFQSTGISIFLIWLLYNQSSRLTSALDFAPLRYLGKISYGVYVYQGLFLRTGPSGTLDIQQFPLNIVLTLSVAIVSYELIEKPILTLKKRFK